MVQLLTSICLNEKTFNVCIVQSPSSMFLLVIFFQPVSKWLGLSQKESIIALMFMNMCNQRRSSSHPWTNQNQETKKTTNSNWKHYYFCQFLFMSILKFWYFYQKSTSKLLFLFLGDLVPNSITPGKPNTHPHKNHETRQGYNVIC